MTSENRQPLHFEKGQCYVGTDTSKSVDMTDPQYAGLKEIVVERNITDGDFAWDARSKELIPASGGRL